MKNLEETYEKKKQNNEQMVLLMWRDHDSGLNILTI